MIGAHILSGCILDHRSLNKLLPGWDKLTDSRKSPVECKVRQDWLYRLSPEKKKELPVPGHLSNIGKYVVSLGEMCRWLAAEADRLGVDVFTSCAASEVIKLIISG